MRFPIMVSIAATALAGSIQAQSPATFDVVSIKPNKSGAPGSETDTTPGRISVLNATPFRCFFARLASRASRSSRRPTGS